MIAGMVIFFTEQFANKTHDNPQSLCKGCAVGAGFIVIGMALSGPVGDELLMECNAEVSGEMKDGMESSGSESMDAAADDMVDCAAQSFCDGVVLVVTDLGAKSVQVREGGELCRARLAPFSFFWRLLVGFIR